MVIFDCLIFSIFCCLAGKNKMDCGFDVYAQSYACFKICEQKLDLLQLLYTCKWKIKLITCLLGH